MNRFMEIALSEAAKAFEKEEVPVGAVIVKDNEVITKAYNNRQSNNNVLGHAEIIAILKAQKKLKKWRLNDCDIYVTLRPCLMCELIIKEARIANVFYLVDRNEDKKSYQQTKVTKLNVESNQVIKEYQKKLAVFFENKR